MSLPDVLLTRSNGNLGRVAPTPDNVFLLLCSGVAVAGKIGLNDPRLLTGTADLVTLGIAANTNRLAYFDIKAFYEKAGEGTRLYVMLFADTVLLTDMCDISIVANIKKALDFAEGEVSGVFISRMPGVGYTPTIVDGLDGDVWTAATKLQAMCQAYDAANKPLFGVLPGLGFTKATAGALKDLNSDTKNMVSINLGFVGATGYPQNGTLAGWLAKMPVHHNPGRVKYGSVSDAAYMPDQTTSKENEASWAGIHDKRYIFLRKITRKSGFFFNDDPTATTNADDYSSISWNRTINKAKRLAYNVLVDHLNDDVDTDPETGGISPALASDWEGEVENAITVSMLRKNEISGVKCTIDPMQINLATDTVEASLTIVRKGQAKTINVSIGYSATV
jgi:hypothetical protein